MLLFQTMLYQDTNCFYALATNYMLSGRSFSEMCEHNAAVAKDFGKSNVSFNVVIYKRTMIQWFHRLLPYI